MEQRQGFTHVTKSDKIWHQVRDYAGISYVFMESIGSYIEVGTDDYPTIFGELSSGDDDQISAAIDRLIELAYAESVIYRGSE